MPIRIDNIFYVTNRVERLSDYYSEFLNVSMRRAQAEAPGLMWVELPVGGMELSFRKAEATIQVHPRDLDAFIEAKPGSGVTVSFEIMDTDATIEHLSALGCRFVGKPLICTGGMEIISIFKDPNGRAVQLYEPRFKYGKMASVISGRSDAATRWGHMTTKEVLIGSNLRDGRNLAYSTAFYEADLSVTKRFYGDVLGLKLVYESPERLRFDVDGTILEFRRAVADDCYASVHGLLTRSHGGIAMFEVRKLSTAMARIAQLGTRPVEITCPEADEVDKRAAYVDPDGNIFEIWQRPNIEPLRTATLQSERVATMETWEFQ